MTRRPETLEAFDREAFDDLAGEFRYVITDMICRSGSGHLGGSLSLVETIITLYWRIMNFDPDNPTWEQRDRLIMSKGHAGPVLYVALAYQGFFPKEELKTINANGTNLPSHCDRLLTTGIDMTAGSLGQGLSCACGFAMAARLREQDHDVYCIVGDGESDEGMIWEAAMFAGHNRLDNLIGITDYNKLQIDGFTDEVITLEPLADKWRSFNWEVMEMQGHDWDDIHDTINAARDVEGRPVMIINHTRKARGCTVAENRPESHNIKIPDEETFERYMCALEHQDYELPYEVQ
ncbi:MAG: transketolase [Armatimonadota bacterium]